MVVSLLVFLLYRSPVGVHPIKVEQQREAFQSAVQAAVMQVIKQAVPVFEDPEVHAEYMGDSTLVVMVRGNYRGQSNHWRSHIYALDPVKLRLTGKGVFLKNNDLESAERCSYNAQGMGTWERIFPENEGAETPAQKGVRDASYLGNGGHAWLAAALAVGNSGPQQSAH